jgi:hypothetical protein
MNPALNTTAVTITGRMALISLWAIDRLARVDGQFVDYRDLAERHLGTIYESLLEYHLEALVEPEEGGRSSTRRQRCPPPEVSSASKISPGSTPCLAPSRVSNSIRPLRVIIYWRCGALCQSRVAHAAVSSKVMVWAGSL